MHMIGKGALKRNRRMEKIARERERASKQANGLQIRITEHLRYINNNRGWNGGNVRHAIEHNHKITIDGLNTYCN